MLGPSDLTHHIWCLGIITNPILDGESLLEVPVADEDGWGPIDPEVAPEDGERTIRLD